MKRLVLASAVVLALLAHSSMSLARGSEEFSVEMASMVGSVAFGSALVLSSPFLIVDNLSDAANKSAVRSVEVRDEKGHTATVEIPKTALDKANVKPGDRLAVEKRASGTLLSKNNEPIAFIIPPQNAGLSKNTEQHR